MSEGEWRLVEVSRGIYVNKDLEEKMVKENGWTKRRKGCRC